tara:strand:+ start:3619 stop:3858 length:240 start_codon:yes stop_codon:yes gene_type:complete
MSGYASGLRRKQWYYGKKRPQSWKQINPEKVRAQQRRYYAKNKERLRKHSREWKRRNPAKRAKQRLCEKEKYHDRHNPY